MGSVSPNSNGWSVPKEDPIDTHVRDEVGQERGVEHGRVVIQPLTEFARWERGGVRDVLALPAEIESTAQPW